MLNQSTEGKGSMSPYKIQRLANGCYRVYQRGSGLVALYNADGTYRHGVKFAKTLDELRWRHEH